MASGSDMVFCFKSGFRPQGRSTPQDVGSRLEAIRQQADGVLDAVDVVVDARDQHSPLHPYFEWDDRKASHKFRVEQARHLIKAVTVVVPDSEIEKPAFTAAAKSVSGSRSVSKTHCCEQDDARPKFIRADKAPVFAMPVKSRADQLKDAYRDLRKIRQRYAQLDELGPLMRAIDAELRELESNGVAIASGDEDEKDDALEAVNARG
jgi:hypothetical protein